MAEGEQHRIRVGFGQLLDESILARARHGDMQAFAAIYDIYARAGYTLALRMMGDAAAAEDVVHDAFIKLMTRLQSYRGDAPFGAWLKRLLVNAAIDTLRRRQRMAETDAQPLIDGQIADGTAAHDMTHALHVLAGLAPDARAILILHQLEGYTHKELAQMFGRSQSYSKSILARTLRRLHEDSTHE